LCGTARLARSGLTSRHVAMPISSRPGS
jgi:hypothetical protein